MPWPWNTARNHVRSGGGGQGTQSAGAERIKQLARWHEIPIVENPRSGAGPLQDHRSGPGHSAQALRGGGRNSGLPLPRAGAPAGVSSRERRTKPWPPQATATLPAAPRQERLLRLAAAGGGRGHGLHDAGAGAQPGAGYVSGGEHHARRDRAALRPVHSEAGAVFRLPHLAAASDPVPHLAEHRQQPPHSAARQRRHGRRRARDRGLRAVRRGRQLRRGLRDLPGLDRHSVSGHQPRRGAHRRSGARASPWTPCPANRWPSTRT